MSRVEQVITHAIANKTIIKFIYDGCPRRVEPHHMGLLNNQKQLHGYQVSNGSKSGHLPELRNFKLADIQSIAAEPRSTFNERDSYNPANSHYSRIIKSIRKG